MDYKYKLTIAIPTYNRAMNLKTLLPSIKRQITERNDVEVIICDNASTDNTYDVVSEYSFIKYYKNDSNLGADKNFLNCYNRAQGRFILLLGSDDALTEGAVNEMITFIDNHDHLNYIFLNHVFFTNQYEGISKCGISYCDKYGIKENYICNSKAEFISVARQRITFMSCFLLSNECIQKVKDAEKYIGTSFIHTCIALEGTKDDSLYGIIRYPCIAANVTPGSAGLSHNTKRYIDVFGRKMKYVLCTVAVQYGFPKRLMNHIFIHETYMKMTYLIIDLKAQKTKELNEWFKTYIFPCYYQYPISWLTIIPAFILPVGLSNVLYRKMALIINRVRKKVFRR